MKNISEIFYSKDSCLNIQPCCISAPKNARPETTTHCFISISLVQFNMLFCHCFMSEKVCLLVDKLCYRYGWMCWFWTFMECFDCTLIVKWFLYLDAEKSHYIVKVVKRNHSVKHGSRIRVIWNKINPYLLSFTTTVCEGVRWKAWRLFFCDLAYCVKCIVGL